MGAHAPCIHIALGPHGRSSSWHCLLLSTFLLHGLDSSHQAYLANAFKQWVSSSAPSFIHGSWGCFYILDVAYSSILNKVILNISLSFRVLFCSALFDTCGPGWSINGYIVEVRFELFITCVSYKHVTIFKILYKYCNRIESYFPLNWK